MAVMDRCCCSGRFVRGENYNNGDHETLTKCKSMVLDMDKKMYNDLKCFQFGFLPKKIDSAE